MDVVAHPSTLNYFEVSLVKYVKFLCGQALNLSESVFQRCIGLYNKNILRTSGVFLFFVGAVHLGLSIHLWQSAPTIEMLKYDTDLLHFRPKEYTDLFFSAWMRRVRNPYELDLARFYIVVFPLGTAILGITLGTALLRFNKRHFSLMLTIATFLALGGLVATALFTAYTNPDWSLIDQLTTFIEALGWFFVITGLMTERFTKSVSREPIIARELGIFFVTVASIYYLYLLKVLPQSIVVVIAALIGTGLFLQWTRLFMVLSRLESVQISFAKPYHSLAKEPIAWLSLLVAVLALFSSWRANQIMETSGYPHIQIAGSRPTIYRNTSTENDILICRQEIIINNVGGSATSITGVDVRVEVREPPSAYTEAMIETFPDKVEIPSNVNSKKQVGTLKNPGLSHGELFGTQLTNFMYPAETALLYRNEGLGTVFVWGKTAPEFQDVASFYISNEESLKDMLVERTTSGGELTFVRLKANSMLKPMHEYFSEYSDSALPVFIPSNESTSLYVDDCYAHSI